MQYNVTVDPKSHELLVDILIKGDFTSGNSLLLETPTWVPGDYTYMQFARDIFSITAIDNSTGTELKVTRKGWQGFLVHDPTGDITVRYRAYAFTPDFGEPSGILDSDYAVLLGNRYLYCREAMGPQQVSYRLPSDWDGTIHHPSGAKRISDDTWEYPSYEILLDTPVVMGQFDTRERTVRGTPFYFVFVDRSVGFEARVDEYVDALAGVCDYFFEMFGEFPFDDYTFVMSMNPQNEWGLEHLTSTMCGLGPDVFTDDDQYRIGVRVGAHELFHAWNVRRLRPAPLLQLHRQLDTGSFTEGLWVAEGFTRYYEFVSCTATGVYSAAEFFSNIVGYFEHLTGMPAYRRVSAVDSSLATYLNHSPKYPGRVCNCVDYYDKGMLIAFGLDATLRLNGMPDGLNRAFRDFYNENVDWPPADSDNPGYQSQEVIDFFERQHPGLGDRLDKEVNHPGGLTTESILADLGFSVQRENTNYLGLVFNSADTTTIYNVIDDSPAGETGIAPMDVITQINGFKHSDAGLRWAANHADPVVLEVLRGHRRLSFTIVPGQRQTVTGLTWNGDARQKDVIRSWLDSGFDPAVGEEFSVAFYENFHGVETTL